MRVNNGNYHSNGNGQATLVMPTVEKRSDEAMDILARRTQALATPPPSEVKGESIDILTFVLDKERYGIDIAYIQAIHRFEQITPVPRTPDFVVGIFSARGRLVSVIDVRAFIGLPALTLSTESQIIVVNYNNFEVGLLADEVLDVMTVFNEDIELPLVSQSVSKAQYVFGLSKDLIVIMDLKKLLNDQRLCINEPV